LIRLTKMVVDVLDAAMARLLPKRVEEEASHIRTGRKGEELAYFWLRQRGYVIIARNWRSVRRRGEVDLIGWEDGELCFIEVKTRTTRAVKPAEAAVDRDKQYELVGMAREYMRRMPSETVTRFDVVSVYFCAGEEPDVQLFKNAFGWKFGK
jgi:putative endonuclease